MESAVPMYVQVQSDDGPHAPDHALSSSVTMCVSEPFYPSSSHHICSSPSTCSLVEHHDGKPVRNAKLPLQMRPIMPQRRRFRKLIHLYHINLRTPLLLLFCVCDFLLLLLHANHPHDHVPNLRLLKTIPPHCTPLHLLQHPLPLLTRRKPLQFDGHTLCRRRRRTCGDGAEEGDETGDGLGEKWPAGVFGESGKERRGGRRWEDEGGVGGIEGGGEDGAKREEMGDGVEGEVGESGCINLFAEGVEWDGREGSDVVGVDDEKRIGGLDCCYS